MALPEVHDRVRHVDAPAGWTDLTGTVAWIDHLNDPVLALVEWDNLEQCWERLDRLAVI